MKKKVFIVLSVLFFAITVFAAEADKYIADLDATKDENTIIKAADWAGEKKEDSAVAKLTALLTDSRDMVRLHSVMALGYIGEENSIESINNVLLTDKNATVRYAALLSTVRIGSKKSLNAWQKAKESETDPFIKDFLKKMEDKASGK